MHSECTLPSTTSLPKLGLRLPSPWMILRVGRSARQPMPRNTSNVWGIWNCRLCTGRNRDPRSLDRFRRSTVQHASARSLKITPHRIVNDDGASLPEGLDGVEDITRHHPY